MRHKIDYKLEQYNVSKIKNEFSFLQQDFIRTFSSPENAVAEAIFGLGSMQPHKTKVYLQVGASPYTYSLSEFFSKKGVKLTTFKDIDVELDDDAFMYIFVNDEPFSGRLYDVSKTIAAAHEKKIFTLHIHHDAFFVNEFTMQASPYALDLFCLAPDFAFLSLGSRSKKIPTSLPRSEILFPKNAPLKKTQDKLKVQGIERDLASKISGLELFFNDNDLRLYDRIVFHIPNKNAQRLTDYLKSYFAYCSSPCFYSHPYQLIWWQYLNDAKQWIVCPIDKITKDFSELVVKFN